MQIKSKGIPSRSNAAFLFLGIPYLLWGQIGLSDGPEVKGNAQQVPSFVAAHFDKPKVRSIHANKAIVRSGPAEKYYATSTLVNGAMVDVYMETSDGWSGIRPPAGSHDWIPSNVAYLLPGGKSAEIVEDKSPAWIGSDATDVSEFMWQLTLAKSQQVQILGEELQMSEDGKKQLWYRIAPPQGEFRWVKTSHLSDSINSSIQNSIAQNNSEEANANTNSKNRNVRLANYVEDETPMRMSGFASSNKAGTPSGKIVWSDEKEALDQVERQIQREQSEIQGDMAANGVHVNVGSPTLDIQSRTIPSETVSKSMSVLNDTESESLVAGSEEGSTVQSGTRIRPIAANAGQKRAMVKSNLTEHQMDAQRQWEAMESTDPKRRIRPMRSVLGLIGLNVIEADQAPPTTRIAQQYHTRQSQGDIGRIGPVGNSRLDRLPRPTQRGSSMTLPMDASTVYSDMTINGGIPGNGDTGNVDGMGSATPVPVGTPLLQGETTFSRWLNSREPIFGGTPSPVQPVAVNNPIIPTTAWHGLNPSLRRSDVQSPTVVNQAEIADHEDDLEEFQTPEIQAALVSLTGEVAGPTESWDFSRLRNQAAAWIENGGSAMVRGEARLLVERIERFEMLRQRTLGLAQNSPMLAQQTLGNVANANIHQPNSVAPASAVGAGTNGATVSNAVATGPLKEGDASGWLVQVHTSIPGQPEFALTDDVGSVIAYVQSTAGLNLRRYLQQPVTVYGIRGYIPNLAAKQILAQRVVRMR